MTKIFWLYCVINFFLGVLWSFLRFYDFLKPFQRLKSILVILNILIYFGHFADFSEYWSFQRFGFFFWSFYWFLVILRFQVYFVHFLDFSNVEVYFLIILDVWGISVMYRDLTAHSSRFRGDSARFWGYFSYFRDFGSIFGHFKIFWVFQLF